MLHSDKRFLKVQLNICNLTETVDELYHVSGHILVYLQTKLIQPQECNSHN